MWVKICANTTLKDARMAAEAGADAVGFVFAPSKRQVSVAQVREISAGLPAGLERVGVFGSLDVREVAAAAHHAKLTTVQLHGTFDPEYSSQLAALVGPDVALIQTVHWALDNPDAAALVASGLRKLQQTHPGMRALLDAKSNGVSGGLGLAFDWLAAGETLAAEPNLNVILAGGLRPETVAQAIHEARPWGVDVASGVELQPGTKDPAKVRDFIENARRA